MALLMPRTLFLHIPKTGGLWCRAAIRRAGIPHTEIGATHQVVPARRHDELDHAHPIARRRFLVAFVRHPLDWWRSYWCHHQRSGWRHHRIDVCPSDDFQAFMWQAVKRRPGWCGDVYCRFVGPRHQPIHFIGRFERLADDLVEALRLAGEEFDERALRATPATNVGDYSRWPAQYTHSLRLGVLRAEREALDRFDYD